MLSAEAELIRARLERSVEAFGPSLLVGLSFGDLLFFGKGRSSSLLRMLIKSPEFDLAAAMALGEAGLSQGLYI
jgi:hypothetical protein